MADKTGEDKLVLTTGTSMRRRMVLGSALFVCTALALLIIGSLASGTAFATSKSGAGPMTPGWGVTSTPVASGPLLAPVRAKFKDAGGFGSGLDVANVGIVKNIVVPGGYFGWHQHSGPSWIIVTQGTLTFYDGDDPTCTGHPVSAGQAYFDPGNHTHNARNETGSNVENYVVRMLPQDGPARIDMPDPGNCHF